MADHPLILDSSDAKQRLLIAAEEIFADYGFEGASIRQICQRAGVNIAGVNYHFGDKEKLYIAAVRHAHFCASRGMAVEPPPPGTPVVQQLEGFIRGMVQNMHAPASPASMKLTMREMAHPGIAVKTIVDDFIQPMAFRLREILRVLKPKRSEPQLLMTGFSIIAQCLYYRQNRPVSELIFGKEALEELTVEMVADHVVDFTMRALGLSPSPRFGGEGQG